MASWAAFVGLTGVLVLSMLALARLSQGVMDGEAGVGGSERISHDADGRSGTVASDGHHTGGVTADGHPATVDPRLPRFESVRQHAIRTDDRRLATEDLTTGALLLNVALTQGLFGAVVAGAAVYFEIPARALGLGADALGIDAVAVGVVLGVVLWIATELVGNVADAAGVGYDETLRGVLAPDSAAGWLVLLGGILPTVAVVEELLFRGAAIGAVAVGFGTPAWAAAIVASLAFGAAHGAQGRVGMALATALGLALAAAFVTTGSLLVVIVAHYLVNAMEFVVHEGLGLDPVGTA